MRIFHNLHVDWMGKRHFFYIVSTILFLAGLVNALTRGFHFGIDFKGGTEIILQFQKPITVANLREQADKLGLGNMELKSYGDENTVLIRTEIQKVTPDIYRKIVGKIGNQINTKFPGIPYQVVDSTSSSVTYNFPSHDTSLIITEALYTAGYQATQFSSDVTNTKTLVSISISDWIKENFKTTLADNPFKVIKEDQVGPKVGNELKTNAVIAVVLSLLGILIFLALRFKFVFAVAAVIALFHDTLITLGLYAILYGLIPGLNLEIDLTVVAAFLTLIGYSINDTVIVFDRVREEIKIHKTMPLDELMNLAVNKTMSRTVLTGGTVLLSIFVLLLFGGEVLRAFSFTMFFGIIIGTYSSVFVASALVLDYVARSKKKIQF